MQIALYERNLSRDDKDKLTLGFKVYPNKETAIRNENCADALHIMYPDQLARNVGLFLNSFKGSTLYAVKANPHASLLPFMWGRGITQFEAASIREVEFILSILPEAEIYFMHPVKSRHAIKKAYELGVKAFAFDCLEELIKIEEETGYATDLKLFLRLHMDQSDARYPLNDKFGLPVLEAPLMLQRVQKTTKDIGVTFHVGSQCMNPIAYRQAIAQVRTVVDQAGVEITALDIGGGFPVVYPDMAEIDLGNYFKVIEQAVEDYRFGDIELLCEPGRAIAGDAGAVAVRVELRKSNNLYLNDGTYGALFDAGISNWKYLLSVVSKDGRALSQDNADFKFYGPTCDSLDVMAGPYSLPTDIQEGDWIVFHHLGAYGYAMQTGFNGFYSDTVLEISAT